MYIEHCTLYSCCVLHQNGFREVSNLPAACPALPQLKPLHHPRHFPPCVVDGGPGPALDILPLLSVNSTPPQVTGLPPFLKAAALHYNMTTAQKDRVADQVTLWMFADVITI